MQQVYTTFDQPTLLALQAYAKRQGMTTNQAIQSIVRDKVVPRRDPHGFFTSVQALQRKITEHTPALPPDPTRPHLSQEYKKVLAKRYERR